MDLKNTASVLFNMSDVLQEIANDDLGIEDNLDIKDRILTVATIISLYAQELSTPIDTKTEYGISQTSNTNIFGEKVL